MAETGLAKRDAGAPAPQPDGTSPRSAELILTRAAPSRLDPPDPEELRGAQFEERSRNISFPQRILNIGFMGAIALASISLLLGALYLFLFMWKASTSIESLLTRAQSISAGGLGGGGISSGDLRIAIAAQLHITKQALLSCSILVGMAFGFLGFSLFLIGIRAEMEAEGGKEAAHVKLARLSPGVFVILCASVMIIISTTHSTGFTMEAGLDTQKFGGMGGGMGPMGAGASGGMRGGFGDALVAPDASEGTRGGIDKVNPPTPGRR